MREHIAGDHRLCSVSIVSTLGDIEWRRECLECLIFNDSCRDARVYVNMEQIVPMPRLRENPTILWLPKSEHCHKPRVHYLH